MSDIIPEGILYGNLGVGSGTTNYNDLNNKPQINSVTLQGNKTASELGLVGVSDIPVTSVNGETGAVVLDGTDINYQAGVTINQKIDAVEQEIPVVSYPVTSVNSKTGAVVLDGTDINYQAGVTINQKIDAVESEIPVVSYPVTSVNGETGAVVLDGTDIEYSSGVSVNSQIDTLMNYIPVYGNTASGSIATFDTSLALPLQDCTIEINAVQEEGTPTPSSPKLISGFTGANIKVAGKNLIDFLSDLKSSSNGLSISIDNGGIKFVNQPTASWADLSNTINVFLPKGTYTFSRTTSATYNIYIDVIFEDSTTTTMSITSGTTSRTATYTKNIIGVKLHLSGLSTSTTYNETIYLQFEEGSTATTYNAYNANSTTTAITWQSEAGTVYGGSLDVTSGVLTIDRASDTINNLTMNYYSTGSVNYLYGSIANKYSTVIDDTEHPLMFEMLEYGGSKYASQFTDLACYQSSGLNFYIVDNSCNSKSDFLTKYGTARLVWYLATPVTYQLTPTQINAIVGTNNVFTDTNGDTSVVYACSLKNYIDSQ